MEMRVTCFGPLYESNTSGTQLGTEALALKTKLATQGARGIMFGQEQAVLFGCADPQGNRWTYGSWQAATENNPDPLLPSDLRYASTSSSEHQPTLQPVIYGFDMAFITDLDFIVQKLGSFAALRSKSFWPFGDRFGTDEGLLQPSTSTSTSTAAPAGDPTVHSPTPSQLQIMVRDEHVNILRRIHASGGVAIFVWHLQNLHKERSLSFELRAKNIADIDAALDVNNVSSRSPTVVLTRELRLKLDRVADFANACVTDSGEKIPFIFRPWHEMNLNFFWWGHPAPTAQYQRLFDLTVEYLTVDKDVHNILYAYSPNMTDENRSQLSGLWDHRKQQSHMVTVFTAWKPSKYDIVGLDAYPARFVDEYTDYEKGRLAFIDSVRALRQFAAGEPDRPIAAITEVGVLNLRGFQGPLPDAPTTPPALNVPTNRPIYQSINNYWRAHLLSDISQALLPLPNSPNGAEVRGSDVSFFMLWKNLDSTEHAIDTATINREIRLHRTPVSRDHLSSISKRENIYNADKNKDEFYGPFLGHPETADFVAIARSGVLTSAGSILRLLFLHDMP